MHSERDARWWDVVQRWLILCSFVYIFSSSTWKIVNHTSISFPADRRWLLLN